MKRMWIWLRLFWTSYAKVTGRVRVATAANRETKSRPSFSKRCDLLAHELYEEKIERWCSVVIACMCKRHR